MSCGGARGQPILWGRSGVSPFLWGGQGSTHPVGVWGQPILWGGQGSACPVGRSRVSPSCGGGHGEIRGQPVLWGGQGSTYLVEVRGQPVLWGPRVSVGLGTGKGFPAPHVWPPGSALHPGGLLGAPPRALPSTWAR